MLTGILTVEVIRESKKSNGLPRMACCSFGARSAHTSDSVVVNIRNATIENEIEREREKRQKEMKILLLGGPEYGKSTVFKQMKILHKSGFNKFDLVNFRFIIYANVLQATRQIIAGARLLQVPIDEKTEKVMMHLNGEITRDLLLPRTKQEAAIRHFESALESHGYGNSDSEIVSTLTEPIRRIYMSNAAALTLSHRAEFLLLDSAEYLIDDLERVTDPTFLPTNEDILRARSANLGITEMKFPFKDMEMRMIDVGGQRSQRRNWLHCFDDVNSVLFIVDVSSYNQWIDASENVEVAKDEWLAAGTPRTGVKPWNRLKHSMAIFRSVARHPVFMRHMALVLFLNKCDIFRNKIERVPLTSCFSRYKGGATADASAAYIADRFKLLVDRTNAGGKSEGQLYVHMTTATDTNNVDVVFKSCVDLMLQHNLKMIGTT